MEEADLCVVGGSCTGVFAAVRASRLGLRVVLLEKQNILGGTATAGLVNIWHSLHDTDWKNQIIAGLTHETVERLSARHAVECRQSEHARYHVIDDQRLLSWSPEVKTVNDNTVVLIEY